jgi:adenine-specific DNA methylase
LKEHRYYDTKTPTPWKKANTLPEHVVFNHQRHIKKEVACRECHGEVEYMDRIRGKFFYMQFCIECHRERKANLDCWLSCHN